MRRFRWSLLTGSTLKALALRGATITIGAIVAENILRLGSNLILTRLLFPEAFGLMALVQTFIQGLRMLSDTGLRPSIIRSSSGDDPEFLNTAWTMQILRGILLWLVICVMAVPLSHVYDEPAIAWLLPLVGVSVLISGFAPTKVATANRHLALGRLVMVNLGGQAAGIAAMCGFAWLLGTIWALVIGGLLGTVSTVLAQFLWLPGNRNRLYWDKAAFGELFHFGKFLFLSSSLGFLLGQGHKLVLGAYLPLGEFGVYNIGASLAALPLMIQGKLSDTVILPLYRHRPIAESASNQRNLFRARRIVVAGSLALAACLAFASVPLAELLYDPRYAMAGPVIALMCFALVPQMAIGSYTAVFLAVGDTRSLFLLSLASTLLQMALLYIAVNLAGTFGVILVPIAVGLLLSPLRIQMLRKHAGWDPLGDVTLSLAGFSLTGLACWLYWDRIVFLIPS